MRLLCQGMEQSLPLVVLFLIDARPGTANSQLVQYTTSSATTQGLRRVIDIPTGILVSAYRQHLHRSVTPDTLHTLLMCQVKKTERCSSQTI